MHLHLPHLQILNDKKFEVGFYISPCTEFPFLNIYIFYIFDMKTKMSFCIKYLRYCHGISISRYGGFFKDKFQYLSLEFLGKIHILIMELLVFYIIIFNNNFSDYNDGSFLPNMTVQF